MFILISFVLGIIMLSSIVVIVSIGSSFSTVISDWSVSYDWSLLSSITRESVIVKSINGPIFFFCFVYYFFRSINYCFCVLIVKEVIFNPNILCLYVPKQVFFISNIIGKISYFCLFFLFGCCVIYPIKFLF